MIGNPLAFTIWPTILARREIWPPSTPTGWLTWKPHGKNGTRSLPRRHGRVLIRPRNNRPVARAARVSRRLNREHGFACAGPGFNLGSLAGDSSPYHACERIFYRYAVNRDSRACVICRKIARHYVYVFAALNGQGGFTPIRPSMERSSSMSGQWIP